MNQDRQLGGNSSEPPGDRVVRLVIATAFAIIIVGFAIVRFGLLGLPGAFSDLMLDRLAVNAVVDGEDPYVSVVDLASRYNVVIGDLGVSAPEDAARVHPRLPGALLLLLPLMLIPIDLIHSFSLGFNALASVAFVYAVALAVNVKTEWLLLATPLLVFTNPVLSAYEFGAQSLVVAGLVTTAVALSLRRDSVVGGAALGIAIALKLWPALLLLPMWTASRRKGFVSALGTSGGLTLLGGLVFGLSPSQVWRVLTSAGQSWIGFRGNSSLVSRFVTVGASETTAMVLSVAVLLPIFLLLWDRRTDLEVAMWGTVLVAILATPLSWDHYNIVLIPVVIVLASRSRNWADPTRWALLGWALATWGGRYVRLIIDKPVDIAGTLAFSERALVMVALVLVVLSLRRGPESLDGKQIDEVGDQGWGRSRRSILPRDSALWKVPL